NEEEGKEKENKTTSKNKKKKLKSTLKSLGDRKPPFSSDWREYHTLWICRSHPTTHRPLAGHRAFLLSRRTARAWANATDAEVDADSAGNHMPTKFLLNSLVTLNQYLILFRKVIHPHHEAMIQTMYASACLLYNCFVITNTLRHFTTLSLRKTGQKEEDSTPIIPLDRLANSIEMDALLSPLLSPSIVTAIAGYVSRYVQIIYYPGYPRRALDLKMCGILFILSAQDAPKLIQESEFKTQPPLPQAPSPTVCTYKEGIKLLQQALDEGEIGFGRKHCEMVEISHWLRGGWRVLAGWERRRFAAHVINNRPVVDDRARVLTGAKTQKDGNALKTTPGKGKNNDENGKK
ncbi:MAG: hypothetical protein EZS28_036541, partial [Streblomastix strix]